MPGFQFGTYLYPNSVITRIPRRIEARTRTRDLAGRHGGYTQGGVLAARRITLEGTLKGAAGWDQFVAAHTPGVPKRLFLGGSRYLMAEVESVEDVNAEQYIDAIPWTVSFLCADPIAYGADVAPALATNGGNVALTCTAPVRPVVRVTVGSLGSGGTITISIQGRSLLLAPAATGMLIVDCDKETVTRGGVDRMSEIISGDFFAIDAPGDAMVITPSNGLTVTAAEMAYTERWY